MTMCDCKKYIKKTTIGVKWTQRVRYKKDTCIVCGRNATRYCKIETGDSDDWISIHCCNDLCDTCKCPSGHYAAHYLSEDIKDIR